jgi:protein-disulfide isomerase
LLKNNPDTVKHVVKHFPLPSHRFSKNAAIAALAAGKQGKFWEFHEQLFKNYRLLSDEKIAEIAKSLELDMQKFEADKKSPEIQALINRDIQNGHDVGVRGTPTIFINGKLVKNRSLQNFQRLIDLELKKVQ